MRGLAQIPSDSQLAVAYDRLQAPQLAGAAVGAEEWALWSQWARLDPRLAEIWCARMARDWERLAPVALNETLRLQPWPAAAGVLLAQTASRLQASRRKPFSAWCQVVMDGIEPAGGEAFFIGQRSFAGKLLFEDARLSLNFYTKWGYFGRDLLENKAASRATARTQLSVEKRRAVLDALVADRLRSGASLGVQDYLDALGPGVSRRVAELDLLHSSRLKSHGRGRGKRYLPRSSRLR